MYKTVGNTYLVKYVTVICLDKGKTMIRKICTHWFPDDNKKLIVLSSGV